MAANTGLQTTLIGMGALAIAMGIARFLYTPLLPLMQGEGVVTLIEGGQLASIHLLGYWIGAAFYTRLKLPPKLGMQLSLIVIALCTLGHGYTEDFIMMLLLRLVCGICSAFILVLIGHYYIQSLAAQGKSHLQGWVFAGVGLGVMVAGFGTLGLIYYDINSFLGWQIFGVFSLVAALILAFSIKQTLPDKADIAQAQGTGRTPLKWRVISAYSALGFGYIIPATFLPVFARETVQSGLLFGWTWPVFGAAAFISTLIAAKCQAYFSNRLIWGVSQIIMALGLLLPALIPNITALLICSLCVGGTFVIVVMGGIKEVHILVPGQDAMRHVAVMTTALATTQMIGPVFVSWLYDITNSFAPSLLFASAILFITAVILLREKQPQ